MISYDVQFSPHALKQLERIYCYVAGKSSPVTALRFVSSIKDHCQTLSLIPYRGVPRDDIWPGLRLIGFQQSINIVFKITEESIIIVGIYYGGQNYADGFTENGNDT